MANANGTSSRPPKRNMGSDQDEPVNPGLGHPTENALSEPYRWFDSDELEQHHKWLAPMARSLNTAMDSVISIGVFADMIRASSEAHDFCRPTLTVPQINAMNIAISLMAEHVNNNLSDLSNWVADELKKGGLQ